MGDDDHNGTTADDDWEKQFENEMNSIKAKNLQDIEDARKAGHEKINQMRTNKNPEAPLYVRIISAIIDILCRPLVWTGNMALFWVALVETVATVWIGIMTGLATSLVGITRTIASGWFDIATIIALSFIDIIASVNKTALKLIE